MRKPKHIPFRTCVACRETDEKRDLLRITRQPDGALCYDPTGKLSGRGAYLCARESCIALARKQRKLERALRVPSIAEALFDTLRQRARELETPTGALEQKTAAEDKAAPAESEVPTQ
jgi:predicted RNA-binding protein YlxR (DUF448 family)